ncbi:hypothetical protein [Nocardia aurantiaca]|uniref:Uncharacterized protein n=1 Tax=Nocardia aurantiaca TaxID=2675850 RepID=A0A6I3KU09_9NOCA|nr:hypothetical protein [Nocardia aurantiaca]MTE14293.1 hypothetical protein [Nocardia aurantiaca]
MFFEDRADRRAAAAMWCETAPAGVPGAAHLSEEPGTVRRAAEQARDWFTSRLSAAAKAEPSERRSTK